ncbi:hypothetical protein CGK62_09055, partial [Vibrio parahaemolyticus]
PNTRKSKRIFPKRRKAAIKATFLCMVLISEVTRLASNWAGTPDAALGLNSQTQKQQSPDFRRGSVLEYGTGGGA